MNEFLTLVVSVVSHIVGRTDWYDQFMAGAQVGLIIASGALLGSLFWVVRR